MKGSIRFVLGLLVVWIAVGSIDYASNDQLVVLALVALAGLWSMYSGAQALKNT
jgi:hypothetical protein